MKKKTVLVHAVAVGLFAGSFAAGCVSEDISENATDDAADLALTGGKHKPPAPPPHRPPPHHGPLCGHGNGGRGGGGGGSTGTGGTGGAPQPMLCTGTPPASPLLTDFSDASVEADGDIVLAGSPGLPGFAYKYAAPGLTAPTLTPTGSALAVAAHPGTPTDPSTAWSGVGIGFDACIDGGAYVGIKFTLAGDTGNCGLTVAAAFAENTSPANAPQGTCITEPCYYPSAPVFGTGTITVPFASMFGGNPLTAVDAKTLLGVQWQLNAPADGSCTASFTIADVELVTNVPPPLCTASVPPSPNITGSPSLAFGSYGYVAPGLQAPVVSPIVATDGSLLGLDVSVNPGATTDPGNAWLGAGLSLPGCIDASRYKGVRFTIDGDLGTCSLAFVAVPAQKQPVAFGGACAEASCWSPASAPFGTGVTTVHFADLAGGNPPGPVDPAHLMNVSWQLAVPTDGVTAPCVAHFTITDVAFTND